MKSILLLALGILTLSITPLVQKTSGPPVSDTGGSYCGCLVFVDDLRKSDEIGEVKNFGATHVLRSWYRWGEPPKEKEYAQRADVVMKLRSHGITIGGGTSLSIVNERDLARKDFDASWLSTNLDGTVVQKPGRQYATLSAPGFRSYLISRLIEQAKVGVVELHLGEPNGEIHFDDWTLGLKGNDGFVQWLANKYKDQPQAWWKGYLGHLGEAIFTKTAGRKNFLDLDQRFRDNLLMEWGKPDSWEGKNSKGEPTFLAFLYRKNLEAFLSELRADLTRNNLTGIRVDVWGFAEWMSRLTSPPDAFVSSPPDERWGLKWSTEPAFSLEKNESRLRSTMAEQIQSVAPVPVVYMIDHPKPFRDFASLADDRQAEPIRFFSQMTRTLGANFAFRVFAEDGKQLGTKAAEATLSECQNRVAFCPKR